MTVNIINIGFYNFQMTISQLVRNQGPPLAISEPSEECRRKFDQWWSLQLSQQLSPRPRLLWHSPPHPDPERKMDRLPEDRVHPALQVNIYPAGSLIRRQKGPHQLILTYHLICITSYLNLEVPVNHKIFKSSGCL